MLREHAVVENSTHEGRGIVSDRLRDAISLRVGVRVWQRFGATHLENGPKERL